MGDVGNGDPCPERTGRDHSCVEQKQWFALTRLYVMDIDAVGVNLAAFALNVAFSPGGHDDLYLFPQLAYSSNRRGIGASPIQRILVVVGALVDVPNF